ncbi:MAG: DUF120 domain-containing protein [Planctomycetes bacterium]|nr:DUF120 domain-containing protein [Planctomycetota bacterium]
MRLQPDIFAKSAFARRRFATRASAGKPAANMPTNFPPKFIGRVQSGQNDASKWLALFNDDYSRKTGMRIFPGSLNLGIDQDFDWFAPELEAGLIRFNKAEYSGERDILLLPCRLSNLGGRRGFIWATTNAARDPTDRRVLEVITDVKLRDVCRLVDGDLVEVQLT